VKDNGAHRAVGKQPPRRRRDRAEHRQIEGVHFVGPAEPDLGHAISTLRDRHTAWINLVRRGGPVAGTTSLPA
jgi:hypothetical protein